MSNNKNTSLELRCYIPSEPITDPIWKGSLSICNSKFSIVPGVVARLSNNTCQKACEAVSLLPALLHLQMLPRHDLWPRRFQISPPTDDDTALYFLPEYESDEGSLKILMDYASSEDLAMKYNVAGDIELLIFPSLHHPSSHHWSCQNKTYLWGVFSRKNAEALHDYPLVEDRRIGFVARSRSATNVEAEMETSQMKRSSNRTYNLRSSVRNCEPTKKLPKRGREKYNPWEHSVPLSGKGMKCKYCAHIISSGKIKFFLKQHLSGEGPEACPKVPFEVKITMKEALQSKRVNNMIQIPQEGGVEGTVHENAMKTSTTVDNVGQGMIQNLTESEIPRATGNEEAVEIVLQEIVYTALETFTRRELEQHGSPTTSAEIPEETALGTREPCLSGNQTIRSTGPTVPESEELQHNTMDIIVSHAAPLIASEQIVPEKIATTSQVVHNFCQEYGEAESSCSVRLAGSQNTAASILHMASEFDEESESHGETDYAHSSAEKLYKYLVKPSLAPILNAIIDKYGDIARECPLQLDSMFRSALEELCIAIQNLQSLQLSDLQDHHLEALRDTINDSELVKLDVKWLRRFYDDLVKDMNPINEYKYLKDAKNKVLKLTESAKGTLDLKKAEMMKLQSEIGYLESNLPKVEEEMEKLKCSMDNVKSKFMLFRGKCLMDGLV